jgi:hypothetical protein
MRLTLNNQITLQWHVRRFYRNHAPYLVITCLREFRNLIATFLINLVVRELPRQHRASGVLGRHIVVPRWGGGGGEGGGDQSLGEELLFLWHSQVQVEHLQHRSSPALDDGSGEVSASDSSRFKL